MRRKGVSLAFVLIVLVLGALITTTLIMSSSNSLRRSVKFFEKSFKTRKEKLIADSFLEWALENGESYMGDLVPSCSGWEPYEKFLDYLSEYDDGTWYDLASNIEGCAKIDHEVIKDELSSVVPEDYLDSLEDSRLFYLKGATYSFIVSYADIEGGQFSWAFGEFVSTSTSYTSPEYSPYYYTVFSAGNVWLNGGWANNMEVMGPILTSGELSPPRGFGSAHFHDIVVADKITNLGWGARTQFDDDVVTNEFKVLRGSSIDIKGRLYADKVELRGFWGGPWGANFEEGICATDVKIEKMRNLKIGKVLRGDKIEMKYIRGSGADLDAIVCANDLEISNYNSFDFKLDVFATEIKIDSVSGSGVNFDGDVIFNGHFKVSNTYGDVTVKGVFGPGRAEINHLTANLNLLSKSCLNAFIANRFNTINVQDDLSVGELNVSGGYGNFGCGSHLCVGRDAKFSSVQSIKLATLTVLGNLDISRPTRYVVTGESSVVGDYKIYNVNNHFEIQGDTYVKGTLKSDCRRWMRSSGFYGDLYLVNDPEVNPACIHGTVYRIDPSEFDGLSCGCNATFKSCPEDVSNCFETAKATFDLIEHPVNVFDDFDEGKYFDGVKKNTKSFGELCSRGSSNPTGVYFERGAIFQLAYDEYSNVMNIYEELNDVLISFDVGSGCPPYDATITCNFSGSSPRSHGFKFNGLVFVDPNIMIGSSRRSRRLFGGGGHWRRSRDEVFELAGNVTFVTWGKVYVYKHMRYRFLSPNTDLWYDEVKNTNYKDVYSFIAHSDVKIYPTFWTVPRSMDGVTGVFISLDDKVEVPSYHWQFTVLGSMISKEDSRIYNSQNVRLILDPRLTRPGSSCENLSVIVEDPFSEYSGGSGGGGEGGFETWIRR